MKKLSITPFIALFCLAVAMKSEAQWNLTGNANATATSILGTTNAFPLNLTTNNLKRLVIDANGRVGIGTPTPVNILTVKGSGSTPTSAWVSAGAPLFAGFGEQTVGNADYILSMASSLANARPVFIGRRSKGSLAAPSSVANNDFLMSFLSSGYDGAAFQNGAAIDFFVDGTPTTGNIPTRISFVTGSNSGNRSERLKVGSTGDVTITTGNLNMASAAKTLQFATPIVGSPAMMTMFPSGTQNPTRMILAHSSAYPKWGLQYNDTLDQFDFVADSVTGFSIDPYFGNAVLKNNFTAGGGGQFQQVTTTDTVSTGGVIGAAGPTNAGYAITSNANTNIGGLLVTDPINNYILNSDKSGAFEGIRVTKSSPNSGTPVVGAYSSGSADGVYGGSSTGFGVIGISTTNYGVFGNNLNANTYAGYFNGNVFATGTFQTSDARLKRNIKSLENGMDIINRLQPKSYEFRHDGDYSNLNLPQGNHYGLLAQDVEKIMPEMVKDAGINSRLLRKGNPKEGEQGHLIDFKAVNYSELIPVIIKAVQELSKKNDELGMMNDELKKASEQLTMNNEQLKTRNADQETRIAKLESMVQQLMNNKSALPCPPLAGK